MGGGKTQTSSSTVSIPPEVLARYNSVNATAEQAAATPFQAYSQDPNAFVAPINATQQAGINQVQSNMGTAQPYYDVATGLTMAGAGPANLGQLNTNQYMSPYLQNVVGTTLQAQQMQNAQQASQMMGQQATSGAFGGDRGNIGLANLAYQQNLANQQALAGQLQSGYTQAQNVAVQQQGADLAAQQANLARLTQAGQNIGGLGTAAQNAAISGGQAALTAGTVPQQTQQAGLTALYNQFLQQQGYPFQTAQFLANIAEGTGALSGSTTTTTGPAPFFSDERVKEGIEPIGETYDGQKIVKFRYKGQHGPKQIGLVAQDVEKHHPEAVGEYHGIKTVDYDKATNEAARRGHYFSGGIVPSSQGGAVGPEHAGLGFAGGGLVDPMDLQQLVAARAQMYAPYASGGLYGQQGGSTPGARGIVPTANLPTPKLVTASPPAQQQQSTMSQLQGGINTAKDLQGDYKWLAGGTDANGKQQQGVIGQAKDWLSSLSDTSKAGGGAIDDDTPYENTAGSHNILSQVAAENKQTPQMLRAAQTGQSTGQGTGLGNLLGAASAAKGLYGLGSDVYGGLSGLGGIGAGDLAGGAAAASDIEAGGGLMAGLSDADLLALGIGLKDGGVVPRQHKKGGGTSDDSGQSTDQSSQQDQSDQQSQQQLPRNLRNNNPGNIEDGKFAQSQPGYVGSDGRFAKFESIEHGYGAMDNLLSNYASKGLNTPTSIISRWAPSSDNNNVSAYANTVAKQLGVGPNDTIDMSDPNARRQLSMAMAKVEGGVGQPSSSSAQPSQKSSQPSGIIGTIGSASDDIGDWYNRNQNWLVPLASGLGAMASSPSRYLGAAILQGIGGAAQASQAQKLQQSQIAKNTMGMFADRFTPVPGGMFDKTFNQVIPLDQFRKQYGNAINQIIGFNKGDVSSQTASAPSTTVETPKELQGPQGPSAPQPQQVAGTTEPKQAAPTPNAPTATTAQDPLASYAIPDVVGLNAKARSNVLASFQNQPMDDNNPLFLLKERDRLYNEAAQWQYANPTLYNSLRQSAMQNQTLANQIMTNYTSDVNKNNADVIKERQNQSVAAKAAVQNDADQASSRRQIAMQMRDTLFDAKGNPILTTGPWADQKADFAMKLNQLGVPTSVTDKYIINAANYAELQKNVAPLAIQGTRAALASKDPIKVSEFNKMFEKGTPNPETMPAEAIKFLIDKSIVPQADLAMKRNDYMSNIDPMKYDVNGVRTKFDKDNQFYTSNQEMAQKELQRRAAAAELNRRANANNGVQ